MTASAYDGPFPPDKCIGSVFAQYHERDGILCKLAGGDAVFWCINGEAFWIEHWIYDPHLRVIR